MIWRTPLLLVAVIVLAMESGCSVGTKQEVPVSETAEAPDESVICAGCHETHVRLWEYGGHCTISCEKCHGPAGAHAEADIDPRPAMPLVDDPGRCLSCHGKFKKPGRSKAPQIIGLEAHVEAVGEKHSVATDVDRTGGKCTFCHDPHSME